MKWVGPVKAQRGQAVPSRTERGRGRPCSGNAAIEMCVCAILTHPVRWGIHTPVQWGILRLETTHRWEQMEDQSEFWLGRKDKTSSWESSYSFRLLEYRRVRDFLHSTAALNKAQLQTYFSAALTNLNVVNLRPFFFFFFFFFFPAEFSPSSPSVWLKICQLREPPSVKLTWCMNILF